MGLATGLGIYAEPDGCSVDRMLALCHPVGAKIKMIDVACAEEEQGGVCVAGKEEKEEG